MSHRPKNAPQVVKLLQELPWPQDQLIIVGHQGDFLLHRDGDTIECSFKSHRHGDFGPRKITSREICPDAFREFLKILAEERPLLRNECYVIITYLEERFKI
jgi:hypothetical protein